MLFNTLFSMCEQSAGLLEVTFMTNSQGLHRDPGA